jgi:hypothetical protein
LGAIERGPSYQASRFADHAQAAGFAVFDGAHFGEGLNEFLGTAFKRMLLIVAPFVLIAVGLSFQNLRLVLLVLFPVVLSLIATLGTFGLLERPIDIPGLMIAVVVLGMGTNFSVYLVHAHQRYPDASHPIHDSVRIAALLDGGATVLGMGVMAASSHVAAQGAGLSGLLGIGFSLFGALVLLPPILQAVAPIGGAWPKQEGTTATQRFLSRFRFLEPRPQWLARRGLRANQRLSGMANHLSGAQHLLVVGCGYGVEAAWILAQHSQCRVSAIEFDEDRSHVTRSVLGDRGQVLGNDWESLSQLDSKVDAVLWLEAGTQDPADRWTKRLETLRGVMQLDAQLIIEAPTALRGELVPQLGDAGFVLGDSGNLIVCTKPSPDDCAA